MKHRHDTQTMDLALANRAKKKAIDKAEDGAAAAWKREALTLLKQVAVGKGELTADDLWVAGLSSPREPRALGAIFRTGQKEGWIEPTNVHVMSRRVACHRRPMRVWKSLL